MTQIKPTYKISASLLNSYIYYKSNPSKKNFDGFVKRLNGVFETNYFLERGIKFEEEVFAGLHGELSDLVKDLPKQVWVNKTIELKDYNIKISGQIDVLDEERKRIYDIKRISKFTEDKYDTSAQHLIYFYLRPDVQNFYYLAAVDSNESEDGYINKVAYYKRPEDRQIEQKLFGLIKEFYDFLKENNLWQTYTENQKAKQYNQGGNK